METITLNLSSVVELSDEQFETIALANQDIRLELTAQGALIIMPPTGGETGQKNLDIEGQLWLWNREQKLGKAFNSSTGFRLPNGAIRSPDASWISQEKWDNLTLEQRKTFIPLCPDFVVELVSESDSLKAIQDKMQEYLNNGLQLGWLINPKTQIVEIYRYQQKREILQSPQTLSGERILVNFVLDLRKIWD
ncbi:protein of unknown function DUF820 [Rippkaea orientalis PCC 8801]|uniref:Putative restriction endonuclease domain-containing protein n=1 Tax=Rippkaea orientalis (strain PCC 8801 / RF-1) TaxID=41431 RepID=B7JYY1_RIPO1|nr:Uma2 family endonuclease [Rippkaea orientalis]ACK66058.1 protein of unknown function DUF820 [Rippkaea orientalis PCC 8801]